MGAWLVPLPGMSYDRGLTRIKANRVIYRESLLSQKKLRRPLAADDQQLLVVGCLHKMAEPTVATCPSRVFKSGPSATVGRGRGSFFPPPFIVFR